MPFGIREDIVLKANARGLLDHNVIAHGGHAASVFRDHFRKIPSVLGRRRAAQPYNSIFVGVDADLGLSLFMGRLYASR